ncbi:MAG: hypothetical protein ACKO23_00190, partial [Gemmataceae bacterium]
MNWNLLDRLRSTFVRDSKQKNIKRQKRSITLEYLEARLAPTANLYVDFGDRYPSGGLQTTVDDLMNHQFENNPKVNGPDLTFSWDAGDSIVITPFNSSNPGNAAQDRLIRNQIMSLLRRYHEPLDINVVELTAEYQTIDGFQIRGAASMDEVSANLGLNETDTKNNDTYVFIGIITINDENPFDFGLLGISNGTDMPNVDGTGSNLTDGSVLTFMGGYGGTYETSLQLALTTAHEGGHSFGLAHASTQVPQPGDNPLIEIMSYFNDGVSSFSRYPMVAGDGNFDENVINSALGQNTVYDQMAFDPEIGANRNFNYVTGTGSPDIITITKLSDTEAQVSVEAFRDNRYSQAITVPKLGGTAYTYTIPLNKPIRLDAGPGNDRIVLDGDLGTSFQIYGMQGTDELWIDGKNAPSAVYTPGTNTANGIDTYADRRGTVAVGSTVVNFQEFELTSQVKIKDVKSFTFQSPGEKDTLSINSLAGNTTVTGKVSNSVDFVPFSFSGVESFVLDVGNNDNASPDDEIILKQSLTTPGLKNLTIIGGIGNDKLTIQTGNLNLPVTGGEIKFLGGVGNDRLEFSGNNLNFTSNGKITFDAGTGDDVFQMPAGTTSFSSGVVFNFLGGEGKDSLLSSAGSWNLAKGSQVKFTGGNDNDTFQMPSGNITQEDGSIITFEGEANDDSWILNSGALSMLGNSQLKFIGGDGNDSFGIPSSSLAFSPTAQFLFQAGIGDDTVEISSTNLDFTGSSLNFDGESGNDRLRFTGATINLVGKAINFTGGEGSDRIEFTSSQATFAGMNLNFVAGQGEDLLKLPTANLILSGGANIVFDAGIDNDTLDVGGKLNFEPGSGITFMAGDGEDTLAATGNFSHNWKFNGLNQGTLDDILPFAAVERLLGGGNSDQFLFLPGGQFTGVLDAGGGSNTLNLSNFSGVRVTLGGPGTSTGFNVNFKTSFDGSVRNINRIQVGSGAGDQFTGMNSASNFGISPGIISYSARGAQTQLVGFNQLLGGTTTDTFTVRGG